MSGTLHRFLRYSLSHGRPIRVMLMEDGLPRSLNLTVVAMDDEGFDYLSAKNKKQPRRLRYGDALAASYARGDSGEGEKEEEA